MVDKEELCWFLGQGNKNVFLKDEMGSSCCMDYKMGRTIEACKAGRNLSHQTKSRPKWMRPQSEEGENPKDASKQRPLKSKTEKAY